MVSNFKSEVELKVWTVLINVVVFLPYIDYIDHYLGVESCTADGALVRAIDMHTPNMMTIL